MAGLAELNRCVYCLRPHAGTARCCGEDCERRVRGKAAYVTRSRREAVTKIMEGLQRRVRFVPDFRRASMGEQLDFAKVFGAEPDAGPIRHGDTLDA